MLKPAYKLIAFLVFSFFFYSLTASYSFAADFCSGNQILKCETKTRCIDPDPEIGGCVEEEYQDCYCKNRTCEPGDRRDCGDGGKQTCSSSGESWGSCTGERDGEPTEPTDPNPGAGDPQDPDPDNSNPDSGDSCPSSCPNGCDGVGNCIWGGGGGGGNDDGGTNPPPAVTPTPNTPSPTPAPLNTAWQGPIPQITILGVTGKPSSQAEVLIENDINNKVVFQTVSIANQFFYRYSPLTVAGIQWSNNWEGPVELSGFNLPSSAVGNVTGYGIGINPYKSTKNMYQIVWVGNNGYRRALTASVNANNQVSLTNADPQWEEIYLPIFLQGQNIQAYDFSYFPGPTQADIGFMLETVVVSNNSYYRFYPLDDNRDIMFNAATGWYGPIVLTGPPGTGNVISFSNLILNESFYNRFMQNLWKDQSGGFFRELAFSMVVWPTEPAPTPTIVPSVTPSPIPTPEYFERFDVNRDGKVTIIDVIEIIKEVFK